MNNPIGNKLESIKIKLFGNLNFKDIPDDPDFKEDSVREVIILPLLKALGYEQSNIVRSKSLNHPFLKVGSKNTPIKLIPDYVLKVENNFAWVLDAKSPNEKIIHSDHVEQVYSYSTHPEIRSIYFALCNGIEFSLYRREATDEPILYFALEDIDDHWILLKRYISSESFQVGKNIIYDSVQVREKTNKFDYSNRLLLNDIPVKKRSTKRHFGVHGYFTKQSWNVVSDYIKNFSQKGDLVLDPFCGSGVTAIEAMMNERKAISIDLNPMAVFIVNSLLAPVKFQELSDAFERIKDAYSKNEPKTKKEIAEAMDKYKYPQGHKFKTHIDVRLRVRYYLISYLRRLEMENTIPTFDEIILYILPLLKNGVTPENQTILSVLEDIAEHIGDDRWNLKKEGQQSLFKN